MGALTSNTPSEYPNGISVGQNDCAIVEGAGAPTDGTSGTGAAYYGTGSIYIDSTNAIAYQNVGTKASPVWEAIGGSASAPLRVINETGSTIAAGKLVAISGYDAATDCYNIVLADADGSGGQLKADGIVRAAILTTEQGLLYQSMTLTGQATNGLSEGDPVYLSTTAGAWTSTAPTGNDDLRQPVGRVETVHASTGVVRLLINAPTRIGTDQIQDDAIRAAALGVTAGTVTVSRAVVAGAAGEVSGIGDLTTTGNTVVGNAAGDTFKTHGTAEAGTQAANVAAVDTTGAALTSYGFTEAQANALVAAVNSLIVCAKTHGLMATS